jgi:glutamyl-tRNA synthetase
VFDTVKLDWISSQNIMNKSTNELLDLIKDFDSNWLNEDFSDEYLRKVIVLIKERLKTLSDVKTNSDYFFNDPKEYDEKSLQKCWHESASQIIEEFYLELEKISTWNSTSINELIASFVQNQDIGFGKLMQPLRVALTGALIGPSIPNMIEVLELETCKRRLQNILDFKLK